MFHILQSKHTKFKAKIPLLYLLVITFLSGIFLFSSVNVLCNMQFLHHIQDKQFLDSPEFESTSNAEEKFQV